MDDTDMTDVAYDIDIDVGAGIEQPQHAHQPSTTNTSASQLGTNTADNTVPAAYFEDLQPQKPWPESLNLQGVSDFDPNDPLYYSMEHCGAEPRVKQLRWVNDSSVNLEFYTAADAAAALAALTHPEVGNPGALIAQAARRAKPYSKKPNSVLMIRETNAGDQKPRGAATRSNYYRHNPDVADNRQREPRRRPPPRKDFLDYGDQDMGSRERRRRSSGDESMNGDSQGDRRRSYRNERSARDNRGRGGRLRTETDTGRLRNDIDSYRPGSEGPGESRFGRLRNRSASPASNDEGDGRFGFAEDTSNARRRYRSRSRSHNTRRRREPSGERWTHDRANHDRTPSGTTSGRWQRDVMSFDSSPMGNHRRSDAKDETARSGSLLARMTKDGRPIAPQKRSLADRITRDGDDNNFGRLKGDDSVPFDSGFEDPKPRRGLADRMTRDDDEMNIRGRDQEGINIRGSASNGNAARGGFNIKGVASGA